MFHWTISHFGICRYRQAYNIFTYTNWIVTCHITDTWNTTYATSLHVNNQLTLKKFETLKEFHKEFPKNSSQKFLPKKSPKFPKKFLRFWKYPIPYIALRGRKPVRACFIKYLVIKAFLVCFYLNLKMLYLSQRKKNMIKIRRFVSAKFVKTYDELVPKQPMSCKLSMPLSNLLWCRSVPNFNTVPPNKLNWK